MRKILFISLLSIACVKSPVQISDCNSIAGLYTGALKMGYVEGDAALNISNDCNFTYTQELNGYDMTTQFGKITTKNSQYMFIWSDSSKYISSYSANKISISGYNWSAHLEKK